MEKNIKEFIEQENIVCYKYQEDGDLSFVAFFPSGSVHSEKFKNEILNYFVATGIGFNELMEIIRFPKEEREKIQKLAKLNSLKEQVKQLETEISGQ